MMQAVNDNNLQMVKHIFERGCVKIPYAKMDNKNIKYGYEIKYSKEFIHACYLGHLDIVKYLYDNNNTVKCLQNLVFYASEGHKERGELDPNYVYNDILHEDKYNTELLIYLKTKLESNLKLWEEILSEYH